MGDDKYSALFAECKWTNDPVDLGVIEKLLVRGNLFNHNKKYFYIFSKSGFTSSCEERAKQLGNVKLISYDEIVE